MELTAIIFGLLSGLISSWTNEITMYLPGLIFGIFALIVLFIFHYRPKWYKALLFLIFSTFGYLAAYTIAWGYYQPDLKSYLIFFLAGSVGSLILSLGLLLLRMVNSRQITFLVLLGGALSLAYFIPHYFLPAFVLNISLMLHSEYSELYLFVIWQTGMMIAISHFAKKASI